MQIKLKSVTASPVCIAVLSILLSGCDSSTAVVDEPVPNGQTTQNNQTTQSSQTAQSGQSSPSTQSTAGNSQTQTSNSGSASTAAPPVGSLGNDYFMTTIDGASNCLTVGQNATYQVTGSYLDDDLELVTENISALAAVTVTNGSAVEILSTGDAGVSLRMNEVGISELSYNIDGEVFPQIIGAVTSSTRTPVILERISGTRCTYVMYGNNGNCSTLSGTQNSGSGSSGISTGISTTGIGGTSLNSAFSVTLSGCNLRNPLNVPVISVN